MTDSDLLQRFTRHGDQQAFADLVQRQLDFVYNAALRHLNGDAHRAEDICQQVFIDLARKAPTLTTHPCLMGWLYASTRLAALGTIRGEQRRAAREAGSDSMHPTSGEAEPQWEQIRPVIDDAMQELDEGDRQSVLLRFFGQQSFHAIGQRLGLSENAAQKRVDRALDRLNTALARRGISSAAAALTLALSHSSVAAPTALTASVTSAALAGAIGASAGVVGFMSTLKTISGVAAAVVVGVGSGVAYEQHVGAREVAQQAASFSSQLDAAESARREVESRLSAAEARWRAEAKRADAADADTAKLLTAIEVARQQSAAQAAAVARPAPTAAASTPAAIGPGSYIVRPGDTGAKIAARAGLELDQMLKLNPEVNWAKLRVGQEVRVK